MEISVIIPAYNVENYVERAIKSVLNQQFSSLEIIVVNDGSTDKTSEKVLSINKNYPQIKLINVQNQGVSVARNIGLDIAEGDYVCFLDADDYLEEGVLSKFYSKCKEFNLDVIRGGYKIFSEEKNDFIPHKLPSFPLINKEQSGEEFLNNSIKYQFNEVVPWLGLFKREYLLQNGLYFPKGIAFEEDQLMFLKALLSNGKFMQTDEYFLTYVYRKSSCARNLNFKKAEDVAYVVTEELKVLKSCYIKGKTKRNALKYISSSFYQLTSIYGRIDKSLRKKCVKLLPFRIRLKLMFNSYNSYHFKKLFLFNFCRILLNLYYNRKI